MKFRLLAILTIDVCLLLLLSGYTTPRHKQLHNGYILNGHLRNSANTKVYLIETSFYKKIHSIDSTSTNKDGEFIFKGKLEEPSYYSLQVKGKNGSYGFVLENTKIHLDGDANILAGCVITGSQENVVKNEANTLLMDTSLLKLYQSADKALKKASGENDTNALNIAMKQKQNAKNLYLIKFGKFIAANPTYLASIGVIDYFIHFDAVEKGDSILRRMEKSSIRNYHEISYFRKQLNLLLRLTIGKQAPEFTATDTTGNKVSLSSLRGRFILLDFWASWCAPCIEENPYLIAAYSKYRAKNFTIISISLDDDKNKWLAAVKKHKKPWLNVSDLKGFNNDVAIEYAVNSIPQNYLISDNGKIIDKNLRGHDLMMRLSKILK